MGSFETASEITSFETELDGRIPDIPRLNISLYYLVQVDVQPSSRQSPCYNHLDTVALFTFLYNSITVFDAHVKFECTKVRGIHNEKIFPTHPIYRARVPV